ncbi:phytase [Thiotrichales bacterium HSG14]|nr:phytase [Thiotrichales bacterium HSG14]
MSKTIVSFAQQSNANFNVNKGILTLPEVNIIPDSSTFSATLHKVDDSNDFILELDSITPIENSFIHYDPDKEILYIPHLVVGDKIYQKMQLEVVPQTSPPRFRLIAAEVDLKNTLKQVQATVETKPVPASGDAADDPAIWIHPINPTKSIIIGTQKLGGLGIYDLAGKEIQYLADGNMNNVDLRYNFLLNDKKVAIVAASNRSNDSIALYKVNPKSRELENIAARTIQVGLTTYGLCMYQSKSSRKYYVFINDKKGAVEQWEVFGTEDGQVDANLVRNLKVKSQVEGCVADDELGHFYLGEERVGIWKFGAEPNSGNEGKLIDTTKNGNLTSEVEGLTIYYINETEGYLIASNQGNDTYTVHNRAGNNEYLGKFQIVANEALNIDHVYDTDGIDVINVSFGENFPYGVFVAQDGENIDPEENQNFKLVSWEQIADALGLKKESSYNPRN